MLNACFSSWQAICRDWNLANQWRSTNWLVQADLILLGILLGNVTFVLCDRLYRYATVRRLRRAFVGDVATDSPVSFPSVPLTFTDEAAITSAELAVERSRKRLAADLRIGSHSLATIASIAPLLGFLGTLFGILDAFQGYGMAHSAVIAFIAFSVAKALVLTAAGIFVSVCAVWSSKYLTYRIEILENELSSAASEAVTALRISLSTRSPIPHTPVRLAASVLTSRDVSCGTFAEIPYDRHRPVLLATWVYLFYIVLVFAS